MKQCALCGYTFESNSLTCHSHCPLAKQCAIICCPNCGYQMVDESQSAIVSLARNVWQKVSLPRPTVKVKQ